MKRTPLDWDDIQKWMRAEATRLTGEKKDAAIECYSEMLQEPDYITCWWAGAFPEKESEDDLIEAAARALARNQSLPTLSASQSARLALRLRIASRIARTLGERQTKMPKGWFPDKLQRLSEQDLLEWLLVDAWPFLSEVFDESLIWADEVEHPAAPSMKRKSPPENDSTQLSE